MAQNSTASAAAGDLYSILLRLLSFTLSQLTLRFVDPLTLGKASIRLELICSTTVLFLGREGFRLALLRIADDNDNDKDDPNDKGNKKRMSSRSRQVNNVAWLSVPVSLCLAAIALTFHLCTYREVVFRQSGSTANTDEVYDYKMAGIFYCLATAIEILSEPCMIACLRTMDMKTRAKAEAFASLGKAFSCVLLLSSDEGEYHAASFGIAQLVYAVVFTSVLYWEKRNHLEWPSSIGITDGRHPSLWNKIQMNFDVASIRLSALFSLQSIFKHALTEGDRIVLTTLVGTYDSGVYAMASSYGGMASRLLFLPLEENGRLLFSNKHAVMIKAKEEKKNIEDLADDL
jgi:oligosaccharide translocation protein RFT1